MQGGLENRKALAFHFSFACMFLPMMDRKRWYLCSLNSTQLYGLESPERHYVYQQFSLLHYIVMMNGERKHLNSFTMLYPSEGLEHFSKEVFFYCNRFLVIIDWVFFKVAFILKISWKLLVVSAAFFWAKFCHLAIQKLACQFSKDFLGKFSPKIRHILRGTCKKLSHLDSPMKAVSTTWDFEKKPTTLLGRSSFNAN